MNITEFAAKTGIAGLQYASHFRVEIFPPSGLSLPMGGNSIVHTYVRGVNLPGRNMSTSEVKYGTMPTVKQVYNAINSDCTVEFMADANMKLFKFFQDWQKKAHDPATGNLGYPDEYKGTVLIHTIGRGGGINYTHTMYKAFPENLGDVTLNYGSGDELANFSVTFSYVDNEQGRGGYAGVPFLGFLSNLIRIRL